MTFNINCEDCMTMRSSEYGVEEPHEAHDPAGIMNELADVWRDILRPQFTEDLVTCPECGGNWIEMTEDHIICDTCEPPVILHEVRA